MEQQDRRAVGVERVTVERVVEICGLEPGAPAFEAESIELSGRGMHVRTPYLPEQGAPLVCRLDDQGREIVVEGVVSWRRQTDDGGEFGIRFTALDSGSVDALRQLCRMAEPEGDSQMDEPALAEPSNDAAPESAELSPEPPLATPGHPVKLHIEGLGSPMKARVQRGTRRRVHVGSNLEFLKVGRNLQIEDLGSSQRLGAFIDSVSVSVDPQTDIPQLVVTLRYEGVEETTPEPSVLDAVKAPERPHAGAPRQEQPAAARHAAPDAPRTVALAEEPDEEASAQADDDDADIERFVEHGAWRERLEALAVTAGRAARTTGGVLASVSVKAASGIGQLALGAAGKVRDARQARARQRPRVTSLGVGSPPTTRRLRPQSARQEDIAGPGLSNDKKKKIALASIGLAVVLSGVAMGLSGKDEPAALPLADPGSVPAAVAPAPAEVVAAPAMKIVAAAPPGAAPAGPARDSRGIVADVPLFGATPMATMEPAPLEPPADEIEATADDAVPDESFEAPPREMPPPAAKPAMQEPEKPVVWGTGKLHLPFVHRIKLNEAGYALEGAKRSTGFTVFLPDRKLLETGKAIERRDDRIVEVRTSNEPRGARVTFVFQGQVPTYKVRLKDQYIEFFVSSPAGR